MENETWNDKYKNEAYYFEYSCGVITEYYDMIISTFDKYLKEIDVPKDGDYLTEQVKEKMQKILDNAKDLKMDTEDIKNSINEKAQALDAYHKALNEKKNVEE